MTHYTKKMVRGVFVVLLAGFFTAAMAYLVRVVLARSLSAENFGLIYAVLAVFGLLSILQHLGLNEALVKYISEFLARKMKKEIKFSILFVVTFQFASAAAMALIFYFLSDYLAVTYFKNPAAALVVKIIALSIVLSPLETIFLYTFQGFQKIGYYAMSTFSRQAALLAITWAMLAMGYDVISYPIAFVAVYVLTFTVYFPIFIKKVFPDFFSTNADFLGFLTGKSRANKELAKKLVHFGIPVILTASATIVLSYTDTVIITWFHTLTDVAYYNVAVPTAKVLWIFSTSIATVLLPLSSELWTKQKKHLIAGMRMINKVAALLIMPASFVVFVFSKQILSILFGSEYAPDSAAFALKMLAIGAIFVTLNQINMSVISGTGRPKYNSMIVWSGAVLNLVLNLIFIPKFGISGAATSTMVSFGLMWLLSHVRLKKLIKFRTDTAALAKIIGCSLAFTALLFLFREHLPVSNIWFKIIISLAVSGIFYAGMLLLTGATSIREVKTLAGRVIRQKARGQLPENGEG